MEGIQKAALFDLDGVIVRTDRLHYEAWKELCDRKVWSFDETVNHRLRGVSRIESMKIILSHNGVSLPDSEVEALANEKNLRYRELLAGISESDLLPGAAELVRSLRSLGVKTAVCSSSRNAPDILKYLGMTELFDICICGLDVSRAKPDPELFLLAASRFGLAPYACVVIEDAESGVEAALAAGMPCVGLGGGEELAKATLRIDTLDGFEPGRLLSLFKV